MTTEQTAEPSLAELFEYLDELRESGRTNMYGGTTYLMEEMDVPRDRARVVLKQWMDSFDPEKSAELRAIEVEAY